MFSSNATKMPGCSSLAGGADQGLQREHALARARATHDERGAIARQAAETDLVESLDARQALLQYLPGGALCHRQRLRESPRFICTLALI